MLLVQDVVPSLISTYAYTELLSKLCLAKY